MAVNSQEVVRPFKSCKWNTHFHRKVSNGKTGPLFQKFHLFLKFSSGTNQKRVFHLHPNRNFRNFLVNGKRPISPQLKTPFLCYKDGASRTRRHLGGNERGSGLLSLCVVERISLADCILALRVGIPARALQCSLSVSSIRCG